MHSSIEQFQNQTQHTTNAVPVFPNTNALLNNYLHSPSCYPEPGNELRQPSSSSRRDVQPLLLQPRQIKSQSPADKVTLHQQHRPEHLTSRPRAIKRPRYNRHLQYEPKPEFLSWKLIHWDNSRREFTLNNLPLPSQQIIVPLKAITAQQS